MCLPLIRNFYIYSLYGDSHTLMIKRQAKVVEYLWDMYGAVVHLVRENWSNGCCCFCRGPLSLRFHKCISGRRRLVVWACANGKRERESSLKAKSHPSASKTSDPVPPPSRRQKYHSIVFIYFEKNKKNKVAWEAKTREHATLIINFPLKATRPTQRRTGGGERGWSHPHTPFP